MLNRSAVQDQLGESFIRAIAARAEVSLLFRDKDYGIDGTFRPLVQIHGHISEAAHSIDYQLKTSTQWQDRDQHVTYALDVKNYNQIVLRNTAASVTPVLLLLKTLPPDPSQWLEENNGITLRGNCYWIYLQGKPSHNRRSVTIRIPIGQTLTVSTLTDLLYRLAQGSWL
ncbi:MAG: DUF4365 domain-containing protein [Oscillatoriales cyanobacterium SM2_2_1]|nr:DUF4365 domain-containing protein [Oscillatoriales cyanobacterium SM2_2_1]